MFTLIISLVIAWVVVQIIAGIADVEINDHHQREYDRMIAKASTQARYRAERFPATTDYDYLDY